MYLMSPRANLNDYRDWCSQVNGSCSIAVSSTGLSRSNLAVNNPSVVSSASGSYQDVGEYHAKNYLKDLQAFSKAFNDPLSVARECLNQVDKDLSGAMQLTESQAADLIMAAQTVTWKLSATACNSLEVLPTLLWLAKGHGDDKELGPMLEVYKGVATVRKEAQAVRTNYIELLNQVRYLGQCIQVTMDHLVIDQMPAPVEDHSGSLETPLVADVADSTSTFWQILNLALVQLDAVCVTLEECSDFWLMLHNAELQLRKLEKEAEIFTKKEKDMQFQGLQKLQSFCQRLRDFCKEHCAVPSSNSIVLPGQGIDMMLKSGKISQGY